MFRRMFANATNRKARGTRRARRAMAESLESRTLLSVTALQTGPLSDSFGPTPPNFGPAALSIAQFDNTTNVLLGVDVGFTVHMQTSMTGSFTNTSNANAVATATLNGSTTLNVAGAAAPVTVTTTYVAPGPPSSASAPSAQEGAALNASATANAPVDPTQTPVPLSVPLIHATNTGSFSLTPAQAVSNGYTGGANIPGLVYLATANSGTNTSGGGSGTFQVTWNTSADVSMNATYFFVTPGSISGQKFNNLDGDAVKDPGELGLAGWTINLVGTTEQIDKPGGGLLVAAGAVNGVVASVVTDASGNYSFGNLMPGTYTITETPQAGWAQTFGSTYVVTIGANGVATVGSNTGNDFGNTALASARISINPDAVNEVGDSHTFTVLVEQDDGLTAAQGGDGVTGFTVAVGANVTVVLDGSNGAIPNISAPSDLAAADPSNIAGVTDAAGQFAVTFSSAAAGLVTGSATATLVVNGQNLTVTTDGLAGNSDAAVKRFVDARITIAPDGTNPVGAPHTFTVTVSQDDGLTAGQGGDGVTGFKVVVGADVTVTLDGTNGAIPDISAPTDEAAADPSIISGVTNASGQFAVTFTSALAGTVTGNAVTTFTLDGVALERDTDPATTGVGSGPGGSGPAVKTFIPPSGHSATIGFWQNKNGKSVILSSPDEELSAWLSSNFPNLYGSLAGASNQQVYDFYVSGQNSYFGTKGTKTNAQVMCLALATYFNDVDNNATAQKFGFDGGLGNVIVDINGNAAAFAGFLEPGGTTISINNMLAAANFYAVNGVIYGGSGSLWHMINNQFDFVNQLFDI